MSEIIQVRGLAGEPRETMAAAIGRRFTPVFQTANGDANIGASGIAGAMYWIVGAMLHVQGFFAFDGAGLSAGTGSLQLPLPPGFTLDSIALESMPLDEDVPGPPAVEAALVPVAASGKLNGTVGVFASNFALLSTDGVLAGTWTVAGLTLTNGDDLFFSYAVPIR